MQHEASLAPSTIPGTHPLRDDPVVAASWTAAHDAAAFIRGHAADAGALTWVAKSHADYVSDVDLNAERIINERLLAAFPEAVIVGEESSPTAPHSTDLAFVVDPLDGTTNFLHGVPHFAVSIGVLRDGALVAGIVWNVMRGEVFTAARGRGAYCGVTPIGVSSTTTPTHALIGTGFPFKHALQVERYLQQLRSLTTDTAGIRRPGAAALDLADVACGRFDAFWELQLAPWDIAAGLLLVREAGGVVTDLDGVDIAPAHTAVYASNGALHPWFLETLASAVRGGER